ncbi:Alpha/Beta hydrolase protein [Aspergillus recurvatus]
MTEWRFSPVQPGSVRGMTSYLISHPVQEPYQIDISWPLTWSKDCASVANAIYLVDGNALFLTATETLRRRQSHRQHEVDSIVVAVGYPLVGSGSGSVFSPRRSYDLTPPCDPAHYTPPDGPDGKQKLEEHGGADKFVTFITQVVRPFVQTALFPRVSFSRTALFGHSYGGLFVLHTLFTRPWAFDVYLAASPSIWWNDRFILSEAEKFCAESSTITATSRPALRLSFGSREQTPVCEPNESSEKFQMRQAAAGRRRMADNCRELCAQLLDSHRLGVLEVREYLDEDHGSVIAPALSGGIGFFSGLSASWDQTV